MTTEVKRGNFIFNEGNLKYSIHKEKEGNSKANTFSIRPLKMVHGKLDKIKREL